MGLIKHKKHHKSQSILLKHFDPTSEKWAPKQIQAVKVEDNLVPTS